MKDTSKLTRKQITDRTGKRTTVWVKRGEVDTIASKVKKYEADILKSTGNKYERGVVIGKNGKVILDKNGESRQIELTKEEVIAVKGARVFTHNHPTGTCLSPADLGVCILNEIDQIRAIAPNSIKGDVVWVFERGTMDAKGDLDRFRHAYALANIDVRNTFEKKIREGKMVVKEAENKHAYEVLTRVMNDSTVSKMLKERGVKFYWTRL